MEEKFRLCLCESFELCTTTTVLISPVPNKTSMRALQRSHCAAIAHINCIQTGSSPPANNRMTSLKFGKVCVFFDSVFCSVLHDSATQRADLSCECTTYCIRYVRAINVYTTGTHTHTHTHTRTHELCYSIKTTYSHRRPY